jgi:hypothetical protein
LFLAVEKRGAVGKTGGNVGFFYAHSTPIRKLFDADTEVAYPLGKPY